jgi:hypothetical protein
MDGQIAGQFQLSNAPEIFFQDRGFDLQLVSVGGVLVMAPSADAKIGTGRRDSKLRGLKDADCMCARETWLFSGKDRFHPFVFQHEREKHCFAAPMFVGRQTGEAITAIDQFFDFQFQ